MSPEEQLTRVLASAPEVTLAVLFGSAARNEARAASDLDVGLRFERLGRLPSEGDGRLVGFDADRAHAAEAEHPQRPAEAEPLGEDTAEERAGDDGALPDRGGATPTSKSLKPTSTRNGRVSA